MAVTQIKEIAELAVPQNEASAGIPEHETLGHGFQRGTQTVLCRRNPGLGTLAFSDIDRHAHNARLAIRAVAEQAATDLQVEGATEARTSRSTSVPLGAERMAARSRSRSARLNRRRKSWPVHSIADFRLMRASESVT